MNVSYPPSRIHAVLLLGLSLVLLAGCARGYVLTLQDGTQFHSASKPKAQGTYYVYKDAKGQPIRIPQGRVREIAPASRATKTADPFTPSSR